MCSDRDRHGLALITFTFEGVQAGVKYRTLTRDHISKLIDDLYEFAEKPGF